MMPTPNKQRVIAKVMTELSKLYADSLPSQFTVLDHLLVGVIQEGIAPSQAIAAYQQLRSTFFDLNELRVSHQAEVESALDGIPDKTAKAKRIRNILQFVFETTYTYDLESMKRKPLKQAQRQLSKIIGVTDFAVAATVQRALGGHSMPIDGPMFRLLAELELVPAEGPIEQARGSLEHLIPKTKGAPFCLLVSEAAADESKRATNVATILSRPLPASARKASSKAKPAAGKPKRKAPPARKPTASRKKT